MYLINLSIYFYETKYNIDRQFFITTIHHDEFYQLKGHLIRAIQPHYNLWQNHLQNAPQDLKLNQGKHKILLLQSQTRISWTSWSSAHWCEIFTHLEQILGLPDSPRATHHPRRHNHPHELQHAHLAHQRSASLLKSDRVKVNPCTSGCLHSWGGLSRGYPQLHHEFNQRHRGQCLHTSVGKLRAANAAWNPRSRGYRQEDKLSSSRTKRNRLFLRQINPWVRQHYQNLVHPVPNRQHILRDYSQDEKVCVRNEKTEFHDDRTEDVGQI